MFLKYKSGCLESTRFYRKLEGSEAFKHLKIPILCILDNTRAGGSFPLGSKAFLRDNNGVLFKWIDRQNPVFDPECYNVLAPSFGANHFELLPQKITGSVIIGVLPAFAGLDSVKDIAPADLEIWGQTASGFYWSPVGPIPAASLHEDLLLEHGRELLKLANELKRRGVTRYSFWALDPTEGMLRHQVGLLADLLLRKTGVRTYYQPHPLFLSWGYIQKTLDEGTAGLKTFVQAYPESRVVSLKAVPQADELAPLLQRLGFSTLGVQASHGDVSEVPKLGVNPAKISWEFLMELTRYGEITFVEEEASCVLRLEPDPKVTCAQIVTKQPMKLTPLARVECLGEFITWYPGNIVFAQNPKVIMYLAGRIAC